MNDEIATLDFALVFEQFDALFKSGSETRKQLKEATPADQVSGVYNNHEGREL